MRYLSLGEVLQLYRQIIAPSGGTQGIRDLDALESALAQPRVTFGGQELYPTIIEKASALGFSLHSFVSSALVRCHPDYHPRPPFRPRLNRQCSANHREHCAVQCKPLPAPLLRQFRLV